MGQRPGSAAGRRERAPARAASSLRLDSPVTGLPRATATDVRRLHRIGLRTVRDLLLNLPFGWESFGVPTPIAGLVVGVQATVVVSVVDIAARRTRLKGMLLTEAVVADDGGSRMKVLWFNQPYLAGQLRAGDRLALAGTVRGSRYGRGWRCRTPTTSGSGTGRGRAGWAASCRSITSPRSSAPPVSRAGSKPCCRWPT